MAGSSKLASAHSKMCTIVEVDIECSGDEHPNSLEEGNTLGRLKETFLEGVSQVLILERLVGTNHWAVWKRSFQAKENSACKGTEAWESLLLGNCKKFNVAGIWYCGKISRTQIVKGFVNNTKSLDFILKVVCRGSDMSVIQKYPFDSILESGLEGGLLGVEIPVRM